MTRVVVIGAGIAGLAAAHEALAQDPNANVRVLEASQRPGGLVHTENVDDRWLIEQGPDAMASYQPGGLSAAKRAGLESEFTHPGEGGTWMVRRDRLHPLPAGLLGASRGVGMALLASRLFSPAGKARMVIEPFIRGEAPPRDESVSTFFRRRFGDEFTDRLVDPLLRGIFRTPTERLSIEATLPRFQQLEREHGSVVIGLSRGRSQPKRSMPPLVSFDGGMARLPAELAAALGDRVHYGAVATGIGRRLDGSWAVGLSDGSAVGADALILAVPAWVAARLTERFDAELATQMATLRFSPVTLVTFGWDEGVELPQDATGFLVPREEERSIAACTLISNKWRGRAPEGADLLRVSSTEHTLPAADVAEAALKDLQDLIGIKAEPQLVRVHRIKDGLPRRDVGHAERVERLLAQARGHDGLALAGSAHGAAGVPGCIQSGQEAARTALDTAA